MPYYPPRVNYNNNINYNNGIQYNYVKQTVPPNNKQFKYPKLLICIAIILIIVFITDIIIQFTLSFNPFILADDVAIFIMAIIYLFYAGKNNSMNRNAIGAATIIVWFVGFGLRGFGMSKLGEGRSITINFVLTAVRTITLFICIPILCPQNVRRRRR